MAVKVKETKIKLKAYFVEDESGTEKTRVFTIADIDPASSDENLYALATSLNPLIEGSFRKAVKGKDETLANEA